MLLLSRLERRFHALGVRRMHGIHRCSQPVDLSLRIRQLRGIRCGRIGVRIGLYGVFCLLCRVELVERAHEVDQHHPDASVARVARMARVKSGGGGGGGSSRKPCSRRIHAGGMRLTRRGEAEGDGRHAVIQLVARCSGQGSQVRSASNAPVSAAPLLLQSWVLVVHTILATTSWVEERPVRVQPIKSSLCRVGDHIAQRSLGKGEGGGGEGIHEGQA